MTCIMLISTVIGALSQGVLSLSDITEGAFSGAAAPMITALADGQSYAAVSDDGKRVVTYDFATGKATGTLFDANVVKGATIESVEGFIVSPDGKRLLIKTEAEAIYRRSERATYYIYDIANARAVALSDSGKQQAPLFSPDGNMVAYVRGNNIYIVKLLYGNAESAVTTDGREGVMINGVPDWVYEEEFLTSRSMVFTADSKQIVYIKYDITAEEDHSIIGTANSGTPSTYKYPTAGSDNAKVAVYSYDIRSRQTRQMDVPLDDDGYIPRIEATAEAEKVLVFTMNRHQDILSVHMVNTLSTVSKQIIQDKVQHYMRVENMVGTIVTDKHIALLSERGGYNGIYIYTMTGQQVRAITPAYDIQELYGLDEATGTVYYSACVTGPTETQVLATTAAGKTSAIAATPGTNTAQFSTTFKYFLGTWSDINTPPVYTLNSSTGKTLATLEDNAELRAKLEAYTLGTKEFFTFTTSEGVTLNGWKVTPKGLTGKAPVILYQYGGPGNRQVRNAWGIGMSGQGAIMEHYLAQQGFVTICVDGRGTGGRGADFEKCTYQQLGVLEARDQVEAALWVSRQPFADAKRIGIWGWSYGGWNTLMAMSEGRSVFSAGVAIAPPTSWRFYDTIYTERYMRTPKENAAGYDDNPISRAAKLHGALLICHGLDDDNVHFRNSTEYAAALIEADKDYRMAVYPGCNHGIRGGNARNHLFRQALNHFKENMKK